MMKQTLLKTVALGLMAVGGVINAWSKIVWPTAQIQYRTDKAINDSPTKWNSADFPKDGLTINKIEASGTAYMWVIQEFTVSDMANVSKIVLPLAYNGTAKDVNVYLWNEAYPDVKAAWDANFVSKVNTMVTSGTAIGTITSSNANLTISDANLSTLKTTFGSTGNVTIKLLLYIKNSSEATAFWGGTADLPSRRPHLEVSYSDITKPVKIGETGYENLNAALTAATDNAELTLCDDCFFESRVTFNSSTYNKNVTIKAAENKDVVIYKWKDYDGISFLSDGKTIKFDGSATGASLTIDNQNVAKNQPMFQTEGAGTFEFKSVTLKNFTTGDAVLKCKTNTSGSYKLEDVTFENCNPTTALILRDKAENDKIQLAGKLTLTDCTDTHISTAGRIKIDETTFNPSETVNITTTIAAGSLVVLCSSNSYDATPMLSKFNLLNADLGLARGGSGHTYEIQAVQAYTLEVGEAKAATLVLPFASTIPTGVEAYTLTYTAGAGSVKATAVETTLPANTPVLVNAEKDSYKFVSTATGAAVTGSGTPTVGALTGVYTETTPGTGHYVLSVKSGNVGFYKTKDTTKVKAYRAYLTASTSSASELFIDYSDDNSTTAIDAVRDAQPDTDAVYYNLNGQRVQNPTKGLYIVNGKKIVIK